MTSNGQLSSGSVLVESLVTTQKVLGGDNNTALHAEFQWWGGSPPFDNPLPPTSTDGSTVNKVTVYRARPLVKLKTSYYTLASKADLLKISVPSNWGNGTYQVVVADSRGGVVDPNVWYMDRPQGALVFLSEVANINPPPYSITFYVFECVAAPPHQVHQPNHGFEVGTAVRVDTGGRWVKAAAETGSLCTHLVQAVNILGAFAVTGRGQVVAPTRGLPARTPLYLGQAPGTVTETLSIERGRPVQQVGFVAAEGVIEVDVATASGARQLAAQAQKLCPPYPSAATRVAAAAAGGRAQGCLVRLEVDGPPGGATDGAYTVEGASNLEDVTFTVKAPLPLPAGAVGAPAGAAALAYSASGGASVELCIRPRSEAGPVIWGQPPTPRGTGAGADWARLEWPGALGAAGDYEVWVMATAPPKGFVKIGALSVEWISI
jgi:hypothetical protein